MLVLGLSRGPAELNGKSIKKYKGVLYLLCGRRIFKRWRVRCRHLGHLTWIVFCFCLEQ